MKPRAIFLMGPTASGKTDLAIALSQHLPVDVISVDSALVYKGMDIGSAKPSLEEQQQAPHQLIDIRDPSEPYSAAEFREDALTAMKVSADAGRIPLLVGGTMMYFKALLEGLADMPKASPEIRAAIAAEAELKGWPVIHAELMVVDPATAEAIHPNHSQRLSRALEVYRASGQTMSALRAAQARADAKPLVEQYDICQIAVAPRDRSILHRRIAQRFELMLEQGLIQEVEALRKRGDLHADLPAIRAVGYRQVWEFLEGTLAEDELLEKCIIATRQLAKRQLTWLRGWNELNWLFTESESGEPLEKQEILTKALNFIA